MNRCSYVWICTTAFIISWRNEQSWLLIKGVSETIKNEAKKQKGGFVGMLFGTLGVSLLGNLLTGKGTIRPGEGTFRAGEGTVRAGQEF